MADILTDPSATYAATDLLATKSNATPRLPADSTQWVIAQWGNEVDSALKALNAWLQGDLDAGAAAKSVTLLGSLNLAENLTALGDTFSLGANAQTSVDLTLLGTNTSTLRILLADPDSATAAGFTYDHSANQLDVLIAASSRLQATSSKLIPTNHNVFDIGEATHRFREGHIGELFAAIGATVGTGSDVTLAINGSSGSGLEPKIDFQLSGTPVSRIQPEVDLEGTNLALSTNGKIDMSSSNAIMVSRVTTADRLAMADDFGLLVFDTDLDQLLYNDGTGWFVAIAKNLEQTLAQGDFTGTQSIFISNGTHIQFNSGAVGMIGEDGGTIAFDTNGLIQASDLEALDFIGSSFHAQDFGAGSGAGTAGTVRGGTGGTTGGAGGALTVRGGHAQSSDVGGVLTLASGDSNAAIAPNILVTSGAGTKVGLLRLTNTCVEIVESSSTPGPSIAGGAGRFWVRDTIPSRGYFTDDTGNEIDLSGMPSQAFGPGNARLSSTNPATYGETGNATPVLYFANASTQTAHWWLQMPKSYVSTTSLTLRLWWTGTTGSAVTNVQFQINVARTVSGTLLSAVGGDDSVTYGPASVPALAAIAGPAVAETLKSSDFTMTNTLLDAIAAGEMLRIAITRLGGHANDTYTGSVALVGWQLLLS